MAFFEDGQVSFDVDERLARLRGVGSALSRNRPHTSATPPHEHFMQTVKRFIMGVTESLCRLENENVEPGQEEAFRHSKTLILAELDKLDGMLASYRAGNPQQLLDALRIVAGIWPCHAISRQARLEGRERS